jgi:hypothetical protein
VVQAPQLITPTSNLNNQCQRRGSFLSLPSTYLVMPLLSTPVTMPPSSLSPSLVTPYAYTTVDTFTATDGCGNTVSSDIINTFPSLTLVCSTPYTPCQYLRTCAPRRLPAARHVLHTVNGCGNTIPVSYLETRQDDPCPNTHNLNLERR